MAHGLASDPTPFPPLTPVAGGEALRAAPGEPAVLGPTTCANCHAPVAEHFCGRCGAPRLDERPLTVRRFADDLWQEVTSLDSGTQRTLRALFFTPGRLTREYLDGRTRWYLSPLRLFLLTIAVYLFANSALGVRAREEEKVHLKIAGSRAKIEARRAADAAATAKRLAATPGAPAAPLTAKAARKKQIFTALFRDLPTQPIEAMLAARENQWFQLVNPLAIAVALALIFRRKRRSYAEHVVHALHLMAFVAILTIGLDLLGLFHGEAHHDFDICSAVFWIVLARYFYLSASRVYGDSTRRTLLDTGLFAIGGQASMMVLPVGVALATIAWLILSTVLRVALL